MTIMSELHIPSDALRNVFTDEVMARLARSPGDYHLDYRLNVLGASGPQPRDPYAAARLAHLRVEKAAWDTYLEAAFACGLFDGDSGTDLRARLISPDYEQFRSGMDECAASWLFAGPLRLNVSPRPCGAKGSNLELRVLGQGSEFNVEVKSPFRQVFMEPGVVYSGSGDDSPALSECLREAAKQFPRGQGNLLVIFPRFMLRVATSRRLILTAFYGQDLISIPIDRSTGGPSGPSSLVFRPDGHLLKVRRSEGKARHTRVSAIMTVEPVVREITTPAGRIEPMMFHDVLVAHNPYAEVPLTQSIWGDWPQLVHEQGMLSWTDGHSLTGWEE
jgi:hypothetical protein